MDPVWQWGIELIATIQQLRSPALDVLFRFFTFLGEEEFYILFLPLFFWTLDFRWGARLGVIFLFSAFLNSVLKDFLMHPRPYVLDPTVQLSSAEGFGLPSGHAQSSAAVWGTLAVWVRRPWVWVVAFVLSGLIGFSRIYLGVHFPTDVLAGWLLGTAAIALYMSDRERRERWVRGLGMTAQVALALAVPLILLALYPVKGTASELGALAGVGVGLALVQRYVPFGAGGPPWQRAVRFLVGGATVAVVYLGLRAVLPGEGEPFYLVLRFVRYGLVGLWVSAGAPALFLRLGLASAPAVSA